MARLALEFSQSETPTFRVLCGRKIDGRYSCGEAIASLACTGNPSYQDTWLFVFQAGWVAGADGVWTLTKRGRARRKFLVRRASDQSVSLEIRAKASRKLNEGDDNAFRRRATFSPNQVPYPTERAPFEIRCPVCQGVNLVLPVLVEKAQKRYATQMTWQERQP